MNKQYVVVDRAARNAYYGPGSLKMARAYCSYNNKAEPGVWVVRTFAHAKHRMMSSRGPLERITKRDRERQRRIS